MTGPARQHRVLVLLTLSIVVPLLNFVAFRSQIQLSNYTPPSSSGGVYNSEQSSSSSSSSLHQSVVSNNNNNNNDDVVEQPEEQTKQEQPPPTLPVWSGYTVRPEHRRVLPLPELTQSYRTDTSCPSGQVHVPDTVLDPQLAFASPDGHQQRRQIPRIVHVTARQRCMAPEFAQVLDAWRFPDHSFFFHDDDSMERLLNRQWAEFPSLNALLRCFQYGGAMKADVWRLLVMWEYGGIYTDIDNLPVKFNGTTLEPTDQGFFQIEQLSSPSQWFFAISPRHPMMYHSIQIMLSNIVRMMKDTGKPAIVWTTGPGAIMEGFRNFAQRPGNKVTEAGVYTNPTTGHTVKLVGNATNQSEWVKRCVWGNREKAEIMERSNMTHLTKFGLKANNVSCVDYMYQLDNQWSINTDDANSHPVYW